MGIAFISFDTPQAQKTFLRVFNDAVQSMKNSTAIVEEDN